jgi:hypothetical protein
VFAFPFLALLQAEPTRVIDERGGLEQAALVGQALTSLLVLVLLVAASVALLALRRALDELTRLVRSTSSDITAAVHDAREVADELRRLTGRVRDTADVVRMGAQRIRKFVDRGDSAAAPAPAERLEGGERPEGPRGDRRRRKRRRTGDRPRRDEGPAEGAASAPAPADSGE